MPENWKLANAAITDMAMRQRDVAALDAKYTKELADAKAENDALRDDATLVVVGCTSKQSVSQCVKPPPPPAWMALSDWQTPLNGDYFTLRERLITMQKQLKRNLRSILMSSAIELPISMGNSCNYCEQYNISFQRSINA